MQEVENRIFLPSYWEMIVIDLAIIFVAIIATIMLFAKRQPLKRANAFSGLSLIVSGLWVNSLIYALDLYSMVLMPLFSGMSAAMRLMQNLHTGYSWYITTAAVVLMLGGLIFTVMSIVRQSDAITNTRREQRESENLLQSIFDNIPVGIIIKNDRHLIEGVNKTYLEWYGLEEHDLLGQQTNRVASFKFDSHIRSAQELEVETLRDGSITTHQIAREFANGEVHYIRVTKFPIFDLSGRITKVGSVSVDMTELLKTKREAEQALNEANEANIAKSRFLATMSHEFRTPLNAIIGYSEMMAQQLFGPLGSERYQEYCNDINYSGKHMLELINDVLDISSIEAGKRTLDLEEVDLGEVLQECRRFLQPQIAAMPVSLDIANMEGLPTLHADRRSVKQIFLNILSNAVKFNVPHGKVSVTAAIKDDFVAVRVADSGRGIPEHFLDTITEPFIRGEIDPLLTQPGTGLGLSIVSSLVDMHHGQMYMKSKQGVGTIVTVSLPASSAQSQPSKETNLRGASRQAAG